MFCGSANAVVDPALAGHRVVIPDVATIEYQGRLEGRLNTIIIRCSEFRPFGADDQGIGTREGFVHVLDDRDIQTVFREGLACDRVKGSDGRASFQELRDDGVGGGFSDIIGIRFEGQPPNRQLNAGKIVVEVPQDSLDEP